MEFIWNKCSAYLKQSPGLWSTQEIQNLCTVQPGNLQVLFIRISFSIENKMQKNNKKFDEEKQFGKTYVANVSTKIGLNFVFSVSFCSLMKCSLSKWKFYHEYHFSQICLGGVVSWQGLEGIENFSENILILLKFT